MIDWRLLASKADAAVNAQFGERIRIEPRSAGDYVPGAPDLRQSVEVTGVEEMKHDQTMGLTGDHAGKPFRGRIAVNNIAVWVNTADVLTVDPKAGDVVVMLERNNQTFEINRVVRGADGRTMFSLINGVQ